MRTSRQPPRRCADDLLDRRPRPGDRRARRRRAVAGLQHGRGRPVGRARRGGRCDAVVHRDLVRARSASSCCAGARARRRRSPSSSPRTRSSEYRQVAILDARGRVAVHVGESCIPAAGFTAGEGFSAQANMVESERVWESMAEAFEGSEDPLADRLLTHSTRPRRRAATGAAARPAGSRRRGRRASRGSARSMCASTTMPIRSASLRRLVRLRGPTARCAGRRARRGGPRRCCTSSTEPWRGSSGPDGDRSGRRGARGLLQPLLEAEPRWADFVRTLADRGLLPHAAELLED